MAQSSTVFGPAFGPGGPAGTQPNVTDDLRFELRTAPGHVALRAVGPPGWQVKAVRAGGIEVTDSGIEVGNDGLAGVEIELTNRLQQISGAVTDGRGEPVADYTVVVFARDPGRWTAPFARHLAMARPDDDGRFSVATLPPGDYYAIALDGLDATQWQDPALLERLTGQASVVSIGEGDTRTLDLKLFSVQ
jgi:hypothetical protein